MPLLDAPPTMVDPVSGLRVWLFDEVATILNETTGTLTAGVARFLAENVEAHLQRRWIQAGRKVTYVHEWGESRDYENEGRDVLIRWGRASAKHTQMVWVHLAKDASPFVRIATSTGISALKFARMPIDQTDDLGPILAPLRSLTPVRL